MKSFVQVATGVAVIANNTRSAFEGAKALEIRFEDGPNAQFSTPGISKLLADETLQPRSVCP